jgi:hypothetical protein
MQSMKAHATPITNQPLDGVSRLLTSLDHVLENARKIWHERELTEAPRFREFSFFTQREEAVSRAIAALITPWGLHGQGRLFLDLLIEHIGGDRLAGLRARNVQVRSVNVEDRTKTSRRIDIVVAFENGFNLGIENKIFDAPEQPDQIADYVTELEERGHFVLLYLQGADGECNSIPAEQKGRLIRKGKLILQPAVEFLRRWLAECSQAKFCKAPRVSTFLAGFTKTSQETADSVVERILASPESLESALAIQHHFQLAVHTLPNQFLEKLYSSLENYIREKSTSWKLKRSVKTWTKHQDCPMNEKVHEGAFSSLFNLDEWRYVEFVIDDLASVAFEIGFDTESHKQFGALYATVAVHKIGPYRKRGSKCECVSNLTLEQEDRLRRKLDVRDHPVFDFLRTDDRGHDWHWQRYIYEPLLPREGNSYQRLYAAVRGPDDRTVGDIADFMIRLGKEVLKL